MTNNNEDQLEPPIVGETIEEAERIVKTLCAHLRGLGWDYAVVSVARRVDLTPTHAAAPGATGLEVNEHRMAPALAAEANALRAVAAQLDKLSTAERVGVVTTYMQDKSDYASGRSEWPR